MEDSLRSQLLACQLENTVLKFENEAYRSQLKDIQMYEQMKAIKQKPGQVKDPK